MRLEQTTYLDELQQQVNLGKTGIISGRQINANQSGYISCVIPESGSYSAKRINGKVLCPLGSQAGSNNFQFNNTKAFQEYTWWKSKRFADFGFWYYSFLNLSNSRGLKPMLFNVSQSPKKAKVALPLTQSNLISEI